MTSFFIFLLSFFCLFKPITFFSSSYIFFDRSLFLLSVFFIVFKIIKNTNFNTLSIRNSITHDVFFLLVFLSLAFCFFSCNSLIFLFWLEICVFIIIFLIFNFSKDQDKVSSTFFIFFLNILGSIPFILFCFFVDTKGESFLCRWFLFEGLIRIPLIFLSLMILLFKLPIFFSHFWLTKAHVSASGPLSIILARLMLKLGSLGLLKVSCFSLNCSYFFLRFLTSVSLISCLFFNLLMIFFFDLKFLVACSSILHISLLVPVTISSSPIGHLSNVLITVGHGVSSLILFFLLTLLYEFSSSRSLDFSKCQESSSKFLGKWIFIFRFLNLGIPPFIGFLRELFIFRVLYRISYYYCFIFSLAILGSLFFTILLVLKILFGKKRDSGDYVELPLLHVIMKFRFFYLLFFCRFLLCFYSLFKILLCDSKE